MICAKKCSNGLCHCSEDNKDKQKECFGYMQHPKSQDDSYFEYCWFNYDDKNIITDRCRCPGILVLDNKRMD